MPAARLNGTSDILWERTGIIKRHPEIQFYDYTKIPAKFRSLDNKYHLTYSFSEDPKAVVAEGVSRVRVEEGLKDDLVLEERVRELGERVDLFPGCLLIEADGAVAGVAHGRHRQVLLVARRAILFADVPEERLA